MDSDQFPTSVIIADCRFISISHTVPYGTVIYGTYMKKHICSHICVACHICQNIRLSVYGPYMLTCMFHTWNLDIHICWNNRFLYVTYMHPYKTTCKKHVRCIYAWMCVFYMLHVCKMYDDAYVHIYGNHMIHILQHIWYMYVDIHVSHIKLRYPYMLE